MINIVVMVVWRIKTTVNGIRILLKYYSLSLTFDRDRHRHYSLAALAQTPRQQAAKMFFPTLSDELIEFGLLPLSLVASAASLEEAGYPADEKASLESLEYRQKEAPDYFMGAKVGAELAGFICGTRCEEFVEETMYVHVWRHRCHRCHRCHHPSTLSPPNPPPSD